MKAFYRLLNYELGELIAGVFVLCSGLILTSWMMMSREFHNYYRNQWFERFENMYEASGLPIVFLLFFIALLLLFIYSIYKPYWGSKNIYTLLTLPIKRELLYWSKLTAFIISTLLLLASQLISVLICYQYVLNKLDEYNVQYVLSNGLLFSFIRSDFIRLLWPYGTVNMISTASMLLVLIVGIYYWSLCERSKRRWSWLFLPLVLWLVSSMIDMRMNSIYEYSTTKLVINSLILCVLSGFFIWHSIHLLKKGSIV